MAKFRRGVNRVTPEFYAELKSKLVKPSDDKKIMREYKIGQTTAQMIRNTTDFDEYRARAKRNHEKTKATRELDKIVKDAKYDRNSEFPTLQPNFAANHKTRTRDEDYSPLGRAIGWMLTICFLLIALGVTYAVLKWAFGL